jgi:hypothetical protein
MQASRMDKAKFVAVFGDISSTQHGSQARSGIPAWMQAMIRLQACTAHSRM